MAFTYQYSRPAVATDSVLFALRDGSWHVLLILRKHPPFADHWALPGGFLDEGESPAKAAARELQEETGLTGITLTPLGFWGEPGRDPRSHVISLVHHGVVDASAQQPVAADDAKDVSWFPLDDLPALAFDHIEVINEARKTLG